MDFILRIAGTLVELYSWALIIYILMSWFPVGVEHWFSARPYM